MTPANDGSGSGPSDEDVIGTGWRPPGTGSPDPSGHERAVSGPGVPAGGTVSSGYVMGVVRGFTPASEPNAATGRETLVWRFRVDQFDDNGNLVGQVPVEMRGRAFSGFLENGYQVGVRGSWRNGRLVSDHVTVYRDSAVVGTVQSKSPIAVWQWVVSALILIAFISFVAWGIIHMRNLRKENPFQSIPGQIEPGGGFEPLIPEEVTSPTSGPEDSPSPSPAVTIAVLECSGADEEGAPVTVAAGDVVRFVNAGTERVDLDFNPPSPPGFDEGAALDPAGTYELSFQEPGSHMYICAYPLIKEVGTITVEST